MFSQMSTAFFSSSNQLAHELELELELRMRTTYVYLFLFTE